MFGAGIMKRSRLICLAPALIAAGGLVNVVSGQTRVHPANADRPGVRPTDPRVWVPPVYEKRTRTVWMPPKYETVHRRLWHDAVYEDRQVLVDVPAVTEWREVPAYDACGRFIGFRWEQVVITPACQRWEVRRVLVREGWWEDVCEQVLVRPGHWETVCEDVLVREGYWKVVCDDRPVPLIDDLRRSLPPAARPANPIVRHAASDRFQAPWRERELPVAESRASQNAGGITQPGTANGRPALDRGR